MSKVSVADLALSFGAVHRRDALLIDAANLYQFLKYCIDHAVDLPGFECVYLTPLVTQPSMNLSAVPEDFESPAAYLEFARSAALQAAAVAETKEAVAYFELLI